MTEKCDSRRLTHPTQIVFHHEMRIFQSSDMSVLHFRTTRTPRLKVGWIYSVAHIGAHPVQRCGPGQPVGYACNQSKTFSKDKLTIIRTAVRRLSVWPSLFFDSILTKRLGYTHCSTNYSLFFVRFFWLPFLLLLPRLSGATNNRRERERIRDDENDDRGERVYALARACTSSSVVTIHWIWRSQETGEKIELTGPGPGTTNFNGCTACFCIILGSTRLHFTSLPRPHCPSVVLRLLRFLRLWALGWSILLRLL